MRRRTIVNLRNAAVAIPSAVVCCVGGLAWVTFTFSVIGSAAVSVYEWKHRRKLQKLKETNPPENN